MTNGYYVPNGNDEIQKDIPAIVDLIERTARWVHPDTFRALPVWAPHAARGQPLYDSSWSRRYTNTRKATGFKADKVEGNVAAIKALVGALGVVPPRPKNWTVCHIWGYDDYDKNADLSLIVQDELYFTCVGNMIWLPSALKGFTDTVPQIKAMLRVCSFHLYGWVCEHFSVKTQAEQIRSGWVPDDYPKSWPSLKNPSVMPSGTAPYSLRVKKEIDKRKQKILSDLNNRDYANYPRERVKDVLKFWNVSLD